MSAATQAANPTGAVSATLSKDPVICVSHGFQTNYERGFCNALAGHGVGVTLISSDRSDHDNLGHAVLRVNLRGSQEEDRPRWRKAFNLLRYHASLMAYALWHRRATVHVIGLLAPLVWCGVIQGAWFRLFNSRYVLTVHDILPHARHTRWARLACGLAYRLPQCLVVHTPRMKDRLAQEFGIAANRIVVMEHGIEPQRGVEPAAAPPAAEAARLLAFGITVPRKGTDLLLQAVGEVSFDFRLVIAGPCPDANFHEQLRTQLENHPRRSSIEWRDDFVPEPAMEQLFAHSDLLVLPYRYIDQSGVLFQALRFGVPVLATRVGQFERYVTAEVGELALPNSAAELAQALQRWWSRRDQFSRARIRQIGQAFEWPATVLALRAAYRS